MGKITNVVVNGFKGQRREYRLPGPTLILGPNGVGKSACLEGFAYALTGNVPTGKAPDAVAEFFAPSGGTVMITDAEGNWLRRGIARHGKTISRVLESNRIDADKNADLSIWNTNPHVLWPRKFLALSGTDLRDEVQRMCGSGQASDEDVLAQIELACARVLLGPAATAESAGEWLRRYSIRETLAANMPRRADITLSEKMLALADMAHETMLGARRAKNDADAAKRSLEAGIEDARKAAADREQASIDHAVIAARLQEVSKQNQQWDAAEQTYRRWLASYQVAQKTLANVEAALAATPEAGPQPEQPKEETNWASRRIQIEAKMRDLYAKIAAAEQARKATIIALRNKEAAEQRIGQHRQSTAGTALELIGEIPDAAHPKIPKLREVLQAALKGWQDVVIKLQRELEVASLEVIQRTEDNKRASEGGESWEPAIASLTTELEQVRERTDAQASARRDYELQYAAWARADKARAFAAARVVAEREAVRRAEQNTNEARTRFAEVGERLDAAAYQARLAQAQELLEHASKAAGAVQAYEVAAAKHAHMQEIEQAWGVVEKAIGVAREHLVDEAAKPILAAMNTVLEAVGRREKAYCELENDRGRPTCDFGWRINGTRTSIAAMSAGQAVEYIAALTVAIANQSAGLRVLLIEADPLDAQNLAVFLRGIVKFADQADAIVVATAADIDTTWLTGWHVIRVN